MGSGKHGGEEGSRSADPRPPSSDRPGVLDRALALVSFLREHDPWDRRQTPSTLVPHLLEETHEVVDAIHGGDERALRDELGDLLLNLAFQIVIGEEERRFTREEVVRGLEEKIARRHPHLFGTGEKVGWETIKARERRETAQREGDASGLRTLDGLPGGLDSLLRAHRLQEKASSAGFDWANPSGAMAKVKEELAEVEEAAADANPLRLAEEIGDLLFAVVNFARLSGLHAGPALEEANIKFRKRFNAMELLARERGLPIPGGSLEEMDALWDEVKRGEK
ncbi:MAG: nucleoside triphosphate pyrophosphohydrolase [Gemmatimonadota bacterium]